MKMLKNIKNCANLSMILSSDSDNLALGRHEVSDKLSYKIYNDMLVAMSIKTNEIELVIPRLNYTIDTIYPEYDENSSNQYFVINDDKIYICLSNNNGVESRYPPTGSLLNNIIKDDGYVWVYVADVDIDEVGINSNYIKVPTTNINTNKTIGSICRLGERISTTNNFDTTDFTNLEYKIIFDNDDESLQGKDAAFVTELDEDGELKYISVTNGGSGYNDRDVVVFSDNFDGTGASVKLNIVNGSIEIDEFTSGSGYNEVEILVIGDGTGATLNHTEFEGSLTNVEVLDGGQGYTWAKAFVFSSSKAIISKLVLMPMNGKATELPILLRANKWRVTKTLHISDSNIENEYYGYIYPNMKFNQISIVESYKNKDIDLESSNPDNNIPLLIGRKHTLENTEELNLIKANTIKELYATLKIDDFTVIEGYTVKLVTLIELN